MVLFVDVFIIINMLLVYIGEFGFCVRCELLGNVIKKLEWILIMIEGYMY